MESPASEDRLVELVLSKRGPDRLAFLEGVCRGDDGLRRRLLDRINDRPGEETVLDDPPGPAGGRAEPSRRTLEGPRMAERLGEGPGDRIDRYKLLQEIGEGGCGTVFMAEQEEPVRRRVALKVIKLGMDTRSVVARFDAERQALAMMDHPNIARVLDAGATASGRPYFVMELVKGIPITRHCDEHELSTRERLQLFILVCHAIQHAHQKGVVHRDIKPSNVLVTMHDGTAVPKVIDFGIAKATEGRLTDQTLFTAYEQFIGTPAYMSPEQAAVSGLDVDTRSDIYSLGVLLYELLTGRTPFDARELAKSGLDVIRRTIQEVEPQRPSTRLVETLGVGGWRRTRGTPALVPATESEARNLERRRGQLKETLAELRGDLDWIVMKCLEKDRTRRYETANGLAADLRRYLDNEPVVARPPSTGYRLRKTMQRNRLAVAATAGIVAALLVGIAASVWQATLATRARDRESVANARLRTQVTQTGEALRKAEQAAEGEFQQRVRAEALLQQMQIRSAEELFDDRHSEEAVATLGAVLRVNPSNVVAAARFVSGLARPFCQPVSLPMSHDHWVSEGEFSPDGSRVATASWDGTARIWNSRTGEPVTGPLRHGAEVRSVQFSPDGQRLVTCSGDHSARIWDTRTAEELSPAMLHDGPVRFARFRPDGRQWMTVSDRMARFWDSRPGIRAGESYKTEGLIARAQYTPLGPLGLVVTGENRSIVDLEKGQVRVRLAGPTNEIWTSEFGPDGRSVAIAGVDGTVRVWSTETGKPVGELIHLGNRVRGLQFSPDGLRLATAAEDGTARIWNIRTGAPMTETMRHGAKVRSVVFSPDGTRVVTASDDKTARIWDARTGRPVSEPLRHGQTVNLARFSPEGSRLMTVSDDRTAQVWNARVGEVFVPTLPQEDEVHAVAFSPDGGKIVTASEDGSARIWDARTASPLGPALRHDGPVVGAEFSPDGRWVVTASRDKTARLWDASTAAPIGAPLTHEGAVTAAEFSPDGRRLVTVSRGRAVRLWEVPSGKLLHTLTLEGMAQAARFSPDGQRLATASDDGTAILWELRTGNRLGPALRHERPVTQVEFSPDGSRLVTASLDRTARLWDVETGKPVGEPLRHENAVLMARFSPDGARVVTASDGVTVDVWDAETGRPVLGSIRHEGRVRGAWFGPDGSRILTISVDRTARLWDAATGLPVSEPMVHGGEVAVARFSPDGRRVVTGALDGAARIWECPPVAVPVPGWFVDWAESWVGRRFGAGVAVERVPLAVRVRERERVAAIPDSDAFARFAQWAEADPGTRSLSPGSPLQVPDHVEFLLERGGLGDLREAVRIAPQDGRAWARLAKKELSRGNADPLETRAEATFSVQRALRLDPSNVEAQQVLRALEVPGTP
ncbi:MAG: protein kinase [Verrucomicrobiales bacterium]|nr:protein kinase [Verrucomicrobiales bacterium]